MLTCVCCDPPNTVSGRYFAGDSGKAVYLTGSHTWANLQDIGLPGRPLFRCQKHLVSLPEGAA